MTQVDRRAFLKTAAVATLAPRALRAQGPAQRPIVIVGAGMAGLRAAERLVSRGARVVVLEARARPGGRVLTLRAPFSEGLHGEAGPIRIPSSHRQTIALIERLGLSLIPFASGAGDALSCIKGLRVPSGDIARLGDALRLRTEERGLTQGELLERYVGDLPTSLADPRTMSATEWEPFDRMTWPAWLTSRGASAGAVELMTLGGDSRQLSALYVLRQYAMLGDATLYKIRGGMDLLPKAMAASLDSRITYGAAVTRLEPLNDGVAVEYTSSAVARTITASHVLVTVPPAALTHIATRDVALFERFALLGQIDAFPAARFLVETRRRTWSEEGLSGSARTDRPAEIWDAAYDADGEAGLLGATVGGALGQELASQARPRAIAAGEAVVADAFPKAGATRTAVYRWAADPWARGAFAVFRPGRMTRIIPTASRAIGRVSFAGEHTAAWTGWTEGAIQSADRAVDELLS